MAPSIPDEIISEIVTPVLHIPDVRFSYTITTNSPFAISGESTSAILLVCKAWLRVSTPLLYNVVVLRSGAQARALASTLKKNPDLGLFIKKLRVEGGFGVCMHDLLRLTPNITDIVVSLQLHSSDSSSGLVLGLPLINPKRLIVWDEDDDRKMLNNKHVKQLVEALKGLKWTNLTTVVFPYSYLVPARVDLMNTMSRMPSVTTASFPLDYGVPREIVALAEAASLQTLEIRAVASVRRQEKILADPEVPKWKKKLRFVDPRLIIVEKPPTPVPPPAPPVRDLSFIPLAASSQEAVDLVWNRILYFAMLPDPKNDLTDLDAMLEMRRQKKYKGADAIRLEYLLVSKLSTFVPFLGLKYLYRWPSVGFSKMELFRQKLAAQPSLGLHIRGLILHSLCSPEPSDPIQIPIFAHTPNLTRLGIHAPIELDWGMFCALADSAGAALIELVVEVVPQKTAPDAPPDLTVFSKFTALRTLSWDHTYHALSLAVLNDNASGGFPALESVHFQKRNAFLLMASMELPCIRYIESFYYDVSEIEPFLRRHGSKIYELGVARHRLAKILVMCPNLRSIYVRFLRWRHSLEQAVQRAIFDEAVQDLKYPARHQALVKMVFDKDIEGAKKDAEEDWNQIFNAFEPGHFPALRELQVTRCEWPPINEHAIAQSAWVKRSERLREFGIKLTNEAGVHWRPRLKG